MDPEKYLILAYLEEDNVQRAFFRVKPMLTAEGDAHEEAEKKWPSEGFLRIVPDKNEQHTFKERMRGMAHWCMIDLTGYPTESNKIRSNKNYSPERGESNQFILYSDAVKAVPENLFYEVLEGEPSDFAAMAEKAMTPRFFLRSGDTFYGPVVKKEPAQPAPAQPTEAVLFPVDSPDGVNHVILCIPSENHITERPVRAPKVPRPAVTETPSAQPAAAPAVKAESSVKAEEPASRTEDPAEASKAPAAMPAAESETAVEPEAQPAQPVKPVKPADEADEVLPIGKPLEILDKNQTFEETLASISAQPLSDQANLLHSNSSVPEAPVPSRPAQPLTGTPLVRSANLRTSTPQPKNRLQEFVAAQCRVARNDPPSEPLPEGAELKNVANPVEEACTALRKAWASVETHSQLLNCILSLEGMKNGIEAIQNAAARTTPLAAAVRRYLQDLEAERLAALVELDKAKADTDEYRRKCVAESNDRVRREMEDLEKSRDALKESSETLRQEIGSLTAMRNALQAEVDELQHGTMPAGIARLLAESGIAAPASSVPLRLNPVTGAKLGMEDILHRIELACNACGVPFERNRVIAFLVMLTVSPCMGLTVSSVAAAVTLGKNMARALGWQNSCANQYTMEQRCIVTPAPADGTPAILLTPLALYTAVNGLKKVFLTRSAGLLTRNTAYETEQWPIFPMQQLGFIPADVIAEGAPVSLASLTEMCRIHPADGETVTTALKPIMEQTTILSGNAYSAMVRFTRACAGLMDGGLTAACDWAIMLWLIPALDRRSNPALAELLKDYPLSCAALSK